MKTSITLSCVSALAIGPVPVAAQDRTELERTAIVGNRELPKVLYIVPWKKPPPAPLAGRPGGSVLDEPPAAIERDVLRRQLRLEARLQGRPATGMTATPTATPTATEAAARALPARPILTPASTPTPTVPSGDPR